MSSIENLATQNNKLKIKHDIKKIYDVINGLLMYKFNLEIYLAIFFYRVKVERLIRLYL